MSDSPELFELDSEEDDDIVAHRLRRADKARRSARQATGASSEPVTPAVDDGTGVSDAVESVFELDPEDDDIFARRRPA
ncbi:MAG: hypothetical protein FWE61_10065, partial [Micrococcales bacterium]|nr:hypothetical protein [Micrococcales bacterium]